MPSTSDKQRRFMRAAAHDPKIAKDAGIPQKVAREFEAADEGKKKPGRDRYRPRVIEKG